MPRAMLVCRDVTEIVTDFIEGRMSLLDRVRFRIHLGLCRHCREYVRQIKTTFRLMGMTPPEPPPPDVEEELLKRFKNWKHR